MIPPAKPLLGDEEALAAAEVIRSGMLVQGKKVAELEAEFGRFIGSKHTFMVGNGTQAVHVALLAAGVKRGDEVITTGFSFLASSTSIVHCGAKPVFADIDPKTFNIDPDDVRKLITKKTKAILPVHLFGLACDVKALQEICDEHDIVMVEDACQSHGAKWNGKGVGTFGTTAAFSFYPTKNMTTGEGGAVTTMDDKTAELVKLIRNQGQVSRYQCVMIGYNYRMTDIHAAIGLVQMKKLPKWTETRQKNAAYLDRELGKAGITIPFVPKNYTHVYHQYTIRVRDRDNVQKKLADMGVGTGVYYPQGLHELGPLAKYRTRKLPQTEKACKEVLALPVHPALSKADLETVAKSVAKSVS
ncbi:MAG: DegT/DnrJ/EryC1/StrS family aminotransferase [Thermoplasmata archaeon]|nr:DegT/DnrJ/EryC1/StrS family aminotransferase [Thermoplasmata archaeon]